MRLRKDLHIGLFFLILLFEFWNAILPVFDIFFQNITSLMYGFPWFVFSIVTSLILKESHCWKYYFILDDLTLLGLLSFAAYIFNANDNVVRPIYCLFYGVLVFLSNGHFRILLAGMKWTGPKVVIYKLIKLINVFFFLMWGWAYYSPYYVFESSRGIPLTFEGILYVIITLMYRSYFFFAISRQDGTRDAEWHYRIEESDEVHVQGNSHSGTNKNKIEMTIA